MSLPAYPGREAVPSYIGRFVLAECPKCEHRCYIPPKSFGGGQGHCPKCKEIAEWDFWYDEVTDRRVDGQFQGSNIDEEATIAALDESTMSSTPLTRRT